MKITESAKEHLKKINKGNIFILPKVKINRYGSCCSIGVRNNIEADMQFDLEVDDTFDKHVIEDIRVFVKKRIADAIDADTEIDYKTGLFSNKLIVNNFHKDRIERR